MATPLLERIEARKPQKPEPIGNRRPLWLRRMDEKGLPAQDRTSTIYPDGCGPTGRAA